ncbi:MAG TPA: alkaline phosphatase family protein, partial [Candidatus Cybelea sp.]|nr:alkaline phosphatase family protein [Candidatus Cybelea sp.]
MRNRAPYLSIWGLTAGLMLNACGGASSSLPGRLPLQPQAPSGSSPIKNVIVIVQENRSFDNFFARFPGADGATRGKMKILRGGKYVDRWTNLQAHTLITPFDIQHCHTAFLKDYDGGKMDGFNLAGKGPCGQGKPVGKAAYQYVEQSQIQPYWDIAEQWV